LPNEKTLELNVTHEILSICRRHDAHAFCFGTTLIQESNKGYDSKTIAKLPQSWLTSPLQYKSAKTRKKAGKGNFEYVFEINNNSWYDQHLILYYHLAGGRKNVAFYVLPAIFTNGEFYSSLPNLLAKTFLVDVADIRPYWVDNERHRLHMFPHLRMATLSSEDKREIKIMSMEEFGKLLVETKVGAKISVLRENMLRPIKEDLNASSKRPRFLLNIFPGQDIDLL